jgi:hypothetical protein
VKRQRWWGGARARREEKERRERCSRGRRGLSLYIGAEAEGGGR